MEIWKNSHDFADMLTRPEVSAQTLGTVPLLKSMLLKPSGHVNEIDEDGHVTPDELGGESYLLVIGKLGGRLIYRFASETYKQEIYLWDHGVIDISITNGNYLSVKGLSNHEEFLSAIQKEVTGMFLPNVQHGHIFAIVSQGGRLGLSSIGSAGIPLTQNNYALDVLEDYNFVVNDLNSSHPSGRIVIMEGEPGTGKTHLIRALLLEVPDAMFILVAPDMVASLAGPELLPLLMTHKQSYMLDGPIILILEDADKCLVTRQGDNIGSIQALLNLGDGILGSLLDLRIVATTNAKKLEIEGAILRDGRLSRRLEVGPLDLARAKSRFLELVPDGNFEENLPVVRDRDKQKLTIAQVYGLARKSGWLPEARAQKPAASGMSYDEDD
jgi:hypothetical protein